MEKRTIKIQAVFPVTPRPAGAAGLAKPPKPRGPVRAWYREAFQADYLDVYLHRDLGEAARAVDFLKSALDLRTEHHLLDLCCGPGRHLVFLGRHVGATVGLDLSRPLLARAREHWRAILPDRPPQLLQANMRRLPLAGESFDRVVNLFTSFGYFEDESDNLGVLREVARVLRPGGRFAIDHINRAAMLAGLRHRSERPLPGGGLVREHRHWLEAARRVVKEVEYLAPDGATRAWTESVRVYEPDELEANLAAAGLTPTARYGDYDGAPWSPTAPRLIVIAGRPSA